MSDPHRPARWSGKKTVQAVPKSERGYMKQPAPEPPPAEPDDNGGVDLALVDCTLAALRLKIAEADTDTLDRIEAAETHDGAPRKGALEAIENRRAELTSA